MNESPIFILGCTKSGTSLLRNLLDGHSQLFVIPTETHFFQDTGYWTSYFSRKIFPLELDFEQKKLALFRRLQHANSVKNTLADGFTKGIWNEEAFWKHLQDTFVNTDRALFDLYVQSLRIALGLSFLSEESRFVEKSVENAEFAQEIILLYPNAKFIHIVRNPYSNLVALKKFREAKVNKKQNSILSMYRSLMNMYNSFYNLYKNQKLINSEQYFVVRYEDILNEPEAVMKKLALNLAIPFEEVMLRPTLQGKHWSGNSTTGVKFEGVSNQNINNWKKNLTIFDVHIVNRMFGHVLDKFGYERIVEKRSVRSFTRKEGLLNYIINRIIILFLPL